MILTKRIISILLAALMCISLFACGAKDDTTDNSNEDDEFTGSISKDDIEIINEIRHYPNLYAKLIKDVKRYVSLIVKKMR